VANATKHNFFLRDSIVKNGFINIPDSSLQIVELKSRFNQIDILKQSYLTFSVNAYSVWYASTHLFVLTSILFAIAGFLIAKQGWDNIKNFYLKASFLMLFFFTTYFGLIPTVFNNKEVGQENTNKYFNLESVQIDITELLKNNKSMLINNKLPNIDSAIHQIDSRIKAINNINFDIYSDKVPKSYKVLPE
jgi:hypothetical protein